MKKQVCKDCYYAGFDKCDHVKKLTKKQEVMENIEQLIEYIETFQDEENWSNDVWSIKIAAIRLKEEQNRKAAMLNPPNLDDVLTKKHSLHGKRVAWSMNGFDGVGIVVDVEDDIAHIAVIDSHSTFQTYANLPIKFLH